MKHLKMTRFFRYIAEIMIADWNWRLRMRNILEVRVLHMHCVFEHALKMDNIAHVLIYMFHVSVFVNLSFKFVGLHSLRFAKWIDEIINMYQNMRYVVHIQSMFKQTMKTHKPYFQNISHCKSSILNLMQSWFLQYIKREVPFSSVSWYHEGSSTPLCFSV